MALFDKFKRSDLKILQQFAESHQGVEGYLEPETPIRSQSLLLVARDGEWSRAAIADRGQAAAFCKKLSIPYYDAAVVGYPERLRGTKGKPAPAAPTAEELEAWFAQGSADPGDR
ncbi:MAG: oxidoreductase [Actinomycetota bacterium]